MAFAIVDCRGPSSSLCDNTAVARHSCREHRLALQHSLMGRLCLLGLLVVAISTTTAAAAANQCVCDDSCEWMTDGECDDGMPGSTGKTCAPGTDCSDCGSSTRKQLAPATTCTTNVAGAVRAGTCPAMFRPAGAVLADAADGCCLLDLALGTIDLARGLGARARKIRAPSPSAESSRAHGLAASAFVQRPLGTEAHSLRHQLSRCPRGTDAARAALSRTLHRAASRCEQGDNPAPCDTAQHGAVHVFSALLAAARKLYGDGARAETAHIPGAASMIMALCTQPTSAEGAKTEPIGRRLDGIQRFAGVHLGGFAHIGLQRQHQQHQQHASGVPMWADADAGQPPIKMDLRHAMAEAAAKTAERRDKAVLREQQGGGGRAATQVPNAIGGGGGALGTAAGTCAPLACAVRGSCPQCCLAFVDEEHWCGRCIVAECHKGRGGGSGGAESTPASQQLQVRPRTLAIARMEASLGAAENCKLTECTVRHWCPRCCSDFVVLARACGRCLMTECEAPSRTRASRIAREALLRRNEGHRTSTTTLPPHTPAPTPRTVTAPGKAPSWFKWFDATPAPTPTAPTPDPSASRTPEEIARKAGVLAHRCQPGKYRTNFGHEKCYACIPGTFTDSYNARACHACPEGKFSLQHGVDRCRACQSAGCPAGQVRHGCGGSQTGHCTNCPKGRFASRATGECSPCRFCSAGQFVQCGALLSGCTPCPSGKFNPNAAFSKDGCFRCAPCKPKHGRSFFRAGCGPVFAGHCEEGVTQAPTPQPTPAAAAVISPAKGKVEQCLEQMLGWSKQLEAARRSVSGKQSCRPESCTLSLSCPACCSRRHAASQRSCTRCIDSMCGDQERRQEILAAAGLTPEKQRAAKPLPVPTKPAEAPALASFLSHLFDGADGQT